MAQITLTDDAKIIQSNFEEIMEKIGWFGKFTVRLYLVMYLTITYGAMNIVGAVFLAADVQHYCAVDSDVVQHVQQVIYGCDFAFKAKLISINIII